ncbi:hypothetical protein [Singulisphaera acidiphila]|uniref:Uncharacterized protein n=1 Tax=Singulisphaera acidiphila (strain ATCC BAA-1392 / DSM 18658 / VKM B-2454 / MOB10) TaxID=886293 RepID=L0DRH5_SINAD|nr:hypothetical protein [Singulisphaera acidiphila]AGA31623.1 hypothetical protein Sinac_7591 [Singulisphaera acidiphila DSM 18658]
MDEQPDGVVLSNANDGQATKPCHLVITVHGIRTYGDWQADLKDLLEEAEPGITVLNYQFGYFSSLAFLVPPLRWLVAWRFRKFFAHAIASVPAGSRIDLVAHSFGTYLAASAVPHVPKSHRLHTIILAGSVLRPSFPWYRYQQAGCLRRVVNECGWDDTVLVLCQSAALMMGMAGRVGFQGMVGGQFLNRYYRFGHGGYFDREHKLMRENWLPILTTEAPIPAIDHRPKLTHLGGARLFLMNNLQFIKVAAFAAFVLAIVLIPVDWMRKADYQKRVERFAHIARLANAVEIPGRDPSHVRDLLRVDVKAGGSERSIDHIIGTETSPGGDDLADGVLAEDDIAPRWWERIPGFHDNTREAFRARQLHARANFQLAAGKRGNTTDLSKARLLYEDAIRCYRRVILDDPANGSYALCLIDYGLLLEKMGYPQLAAEQFRKVREDVFPRDAKGESSTMPRSLVIDSLGYEAAALRSLEKWDESTDRLLQAVREAKGEDSLLSFVYNELAWHRMERLDVAKAREAFLKAKASCEALVENGQFVFKTRLYHIRHGLAMAERLCGRPDEAYGQYDQLVKELQELMRNDLDFNPKERRDLRTRLVNSMERRADVRFFSRRTPTFFQEVTPERYLGLLAKVEQDYQEAIEQVANDDLSSKIQLLYKKVIVRCLAEMGRNSVDQTRAKDPLDRPVLAPIDIEFAESERTYNALPPERRKTLKFYHEIAVACMDLHKVPDRDAYLTVDGADPGTSRTRRYAPRSIEELRALTTRYGAQCETLNRERVEMLLVALEVLLEVGVETNDPKSSQDASQMMAVLGATTKVASHDELRAYVNRFNRIAASKLVSQEELTASRSHPRIEAKRVAHDPALPITPGGRLLFYLQLSPTRSLTLTEAAESTPPPAPIAESLITKPQTDKPRSDHEDELAPRTAMKRPLDQP